MRATLEHELKLDADEGFVLPDLGGEALTARVFTSTYYDTPPRSLGRVGITLRRRVEGDSSLWQLKLPRGGKGTVRAELEEPGGAEGPPESLARLLVAHLRHGALEPVAALRTQRSGVRVLDGERVVAEATVDAVDVLDTDVGFTEIEVELVDGAEADLERLGGELREAGARTSSGAPKLMRVLELPETPAPATGATLAEQLRHFFAVQLAELERHDPGVRLGAEPEDLHRFRVATRRTRALVRATRPLLGDQLAALGEELRWLGSVLGPVRDLDVLLGRLRKEVAALDADEPAGQELLRGLDAQRNDVRAPLLAALDSTRYSALLDSFEAAIETIDPGAVEGGAPAIARDAVQRLQRASDKLRKTPSDEQLHRLRIDAKRARYAAELAALTGDSAAARAVDAFKRVQDVIGEHQDAVVAEERIRGLADASTAVAAGRLIEQERARKKAMRAAYPEAVAHALDEARSAFP